MSAFPRQTLVPPSTAYEQVKPATEVRGTQIATSLTLVRERGLEEPYFASLPAGQKEAVRSLEPLSWVSMELAVDHYRVMDRLFSSKEQQIENGRLAAERTMTTYVKTIVRALQATGPVDPTVLLKRLAPATERAIRGGGATAAYRVGPKDARAEMVGFPVLSVAYVRNAWQGIFESMLSLTARTVMLRQDPRFERPDRIAFLISWV